MKLYLNVIILLLTVSSSFMSCNKKPKEFNFLLVENGSIVENLGFSQGVA